MNKETTLYPFDEFWSLYPRRVKKKACRKIYSKIIDEHEEIIKWLKDYLEKWEDEWIELQFIPHPTTWLNWEQRTDEIVSERPLTKDELYQKKKQEYLLELNKEQWSNQTQ